MSYVLNDPNCDSIVANTGIPGCAFDPDKIVGIILVPKGKIFDATDILTLPTVLQGLTTAALGQRVYPIFRFEEMADNSEEATEQAYGYGYSRIVRDGKYKWSFKIINGGVQYLAALRKFNKNSNFKMLLVLSDGTIVGTMSGTTAMTGIDGYFYAEPWKANDGSGSAASYQVRVVLSDPAEINEHVAFVATATDIEAAVTGLLDVELYLIAQAAATLTVGIRTVSGKVSLYDNYEDDLNDLALWTVTKSESVVTPTGIAKDTTNGGWTITLTTPTGAHVVALASAATLEANDVGGAPEPGYEANGTLTVTFA